MAAYEAVDSCAEIDPRKTTPLTVYFDGACPLCRAEIDFYRKQAGAGGICFEDVSAAGWVGAPEAGVPRHEAVEALSRDQALKRFHVRLPDGTLVSGAAAFVNLWRVLPRLQWASKFAGIAGVMIILETAYGAFLPVRPILSKAFGALQARRRPS